MTLSRDTHRDVSEVLVRYASGIDRRDWELLASCFTADCVADYGEIGTWHSAAEVTEFMRTAHEGCGQTLHRITNIEVRAEAGGVAARSYVDALILMADNKSGVRAVGYYDDRLVDGGDGWRIADRRFTSVFFQMVKNEQR